MSTREVYPQKSSIGDLDANVIALLVYLIPILATGIFNAKNIIWIVPLIFYFIEKSSSFVKFHAMQSTVLYLVGSVVRLVISVIISGVFSLSPLISATKIGSIINFGVTGISSLFLGLLVSVVSIAVFVFSVISSINAYGYKEYDIPFISFLSEKIKTRIK